MQIVFVLIWWFERLADVFGLPDAFPDRAQPLVMLPIALRIRTALVTHINDLVIIINNFDYKTVVLEAIDGLGSNWDRHGACSSLWQKLGPQAKMNRRILS